MVFDRLSALCETVDISDATFRFIDPFTVEVVYSDGSGSLLTWNCQSNKWVDDWGRSCDRGLPGN